MSKYAWNGYADRALNIIVGCSNVNCPCRNVCWARRMAKRDKRCPKCQTFEPHFHLERMRNFRKPQVIALNFMGDWLDPAFDPQNIEMLLRTCWYQHQKTWLLLTKRYEEFANFAVRKIRTYENFWFGISVTSETDLLVALPHWQKIPADFKRWISFEPLLGEISVETLRKLNPKPNQIVIGAQTRPHINPPWLSVEHIIAYSFSESIPLFVKDNMPQHTTRFRQLAWDRRTEEKS